MTVHKRLHPWNVYEESACVNFSTLQSVYQATAQMQGVVHCSADTPLLQDNKYTVHLFPVGMQYQSAAPSSEDELKRAAHGLLHGLSAIHKVCGQGLLVHGLA